MKNGPNWSVIAVGAAFLVGGVALVVAGYTQPGLPVLAVGLGLGLAGFIGPRWLPGGRSEP